MIWLSIDVIVNMNMSWKLHIHQTENMQEKLLQENDKLEDARPTRLINSC